MSDILQKIADQTAEDLKKQKRRVSLRDLESMKGFEKERLSFKEALESPGISVIAEVKKASPSKGVIREDFNPEQIAAQYIDNGAAAISVLTDKPFFQGSLTYLEKISGMSPIPLLRKDFILDPYQVKEARAYGADAVLLIVTMYSGQQLEELISACREFELEALVECYYKEEVESLSWDQISVVGVNNRNLSTFEVDLHRGVDLLKLAPERVLTVSESGLHSPEDLHYLRLNGIDAALMGEHLMKQKQPGAALSHLRKKLDEIAVEQNG
jgi:indole-3-glycerol phosphate synthase